MANLICLDCPDADELRMLRALVSEGITASRLAPYVRQFHGWRICVWCSGERCCAATHIEVRCRDGGLWDEAHTYLGCCSDGRRS